MEHERTPAQKRKDGIFAANGRKHWGEITVSDEATQARNRSRDRTAGTVVCRECGKRFTHVRTYQDHRLGRAKDLPCPTPRELRQAGWRKDEKGYWSCRDGRGTAKVA